MADKSANARKQPPQPSRTRLQRRAPASILVTPASNWNVAIPLLSPLATSPDVKRTCGGVDNDYNKSVNETEKKAPVVVCKKWQHPAAPFYYEPAPTLLHSVCTGVVDRS